jgi:hypothetical protein
MVRRTAELLLLIIAVAAAAGAGTKELRIQLLLEPDLELDGSEAIFVGPVLIEPRGDDPTSSLDLYAAREFDDHLRKVLRRKTRLKLLPPVESLDPPTKEPNRLAGMAEFWQTLGEETGADYIVSAAIDVKVLDRAGYTTEEYVSPTDGKTYFRQVLVEETGFNFDILLMVFDGHSGEVVLEEQITDFKERSERKLEQYEDMYSDLYNLETRLLGVFVPRSMVAKRTVYTN